VSHPTAELAAAAAAYLEAMDGRRRQVRLTATGRFLVLRDRRR
jgi:hypothetical protein